MVWPLGSCKSTGKVPETGLRGGEKRRSQWGQQQCSRHFIQEWCKKKNYGSQIKTMEASDRPTLCHNQAQQLIEIKQDSVHRNKWTLVSSGNINWRPHIFFFILDLMWHISLALIWTSGLLTKETLKHSFKCRIFKHLFKAKRCFFERCFASWLVDMDKQRFNRF